MSLTATPTTRRLYLSLCQHCVWTLHPSLMLTTYALRHCACDRCRRTSDLAMAGLDPSHPEYDHCLQHMTSPPVPAALPRLPSSHFLGGAPCPPIPSPR